MKNHFKNSNYTNNKNEKISSLDSTIINIAENNEIKNDDIDVEMKIENELNNSLNNEQMNISNEEYFKKKKKCNDSYNHTDNSYGDNYSTANSNVENDKSKQKLNISKESNEFTNEGNNEIKKEMLLNEIHNSDIQNVNEYMDEILDNLINEEKNNKCEINPNYFKYQTEINDSMRNILIDWLIESHRQFNFKEETLYRAICIMDSYLSKKFIQRKNFQLLGITSLFIAAKLNEIYYRRIIDYAFITDNAYTIDDIKLMEVDISKTLNFNFLVPSPLSFFEIIADKIGISEDLNKFHFGEFLIQSFLLDFQSLKYSYSTIACACCYVIMKFYKMKNSQICYNSRYYSIKDCNINDNTGYIINYCAKNICSVISELFNLNIQSLFKKYSNYQFYEDIRKILGSNN